jgi:DNA end-binding protein Ku
MTKALWNGYISFGLVNIPVALVTAVRDKGVHFHLLHRKDGARLHQKLVCPLDGEEVGRKQAARGFEIEPDRYVLVEDDELKALAPERTRMIEVSDFVDLGQIDPIYYDRPYYLVPQDGGGKAYSLLLQAMVEKSKTGIGKLVFHEREHVVALRPLGDILCVEIMRFADEIVSRRELEEIAAQESSSDKKQLELAKELIDALAGDFEPEKYKDEYRSAVQDLIERKAKGEEIVTAPEEFEEGEVIDLMAALEKSLNRVRGGAGKGGAAAEKKPARRGRKKTAPGA